jgi:hypothetical protein
MAPRNGRGVAAGEDSSPHGDARLEAPADHGDPRKLLWLAVIEQALSDCRLPTARSSGASAALLADREEAHRFLCDQTGPRARWRRHVCQLAGLDVDVLEELVARERRTWPLLSEQVNPDRRGQRDASQKVAPVTVADPEKAARLAREAHERRKTRNREYARRRAARERAAQESPQSYRTHASLNGSAWTSPTYND